MSFQFSVFSFQWKRQGVPCVPEFVQSVLIGKRRLDHVADAPARELKTENRKLKTAYPAVDETRAVLMTLSKENYRVCQLKSI
ncbi:MAG: hypothetical protein ACRD9R_22625 [Pyrinomonadaceae bacterium]